MWLAILLAGCTTHFNRPYPPPADEAVRPVLAVSSFENRSGFTGQWELGSGMADLLVSELVNTRHVVVVERGQLDKIVGEIQRQRSQLFRPEGRVDGGRLRNAQYLVRGVIQDFSQTGGGSVALFLRRVFTLGLGGYRARVALTLTVIDVETGEIIDSVLATASVTARSAYAASQYKNVAFGGDVFFRTPLGAATGAAIQRSVRAVLQSLPRREWQPMIAAEAGGRLVLNGGAARGLTRGRLYEVRGDGQPITDPATGEILSVLPGSTLGVVRVTEVGDTVSYAEPVRGGGFQRGHRLVPLRTPRTP